MEGATVFNVPNPPYTPSNEIRICKGVCFEPSMTNTVLWDDINAQLSYIVSKTVNRFTDFTPFRISEKVVLVPNPADSYYNCNYIAFRNSDFNSNKWYFAFITQVDFVDMYTSRLHFEIDVLQTYMFDYQLGATYVERWHTYTDEPGDNLVPDNLELGDYIINNQQQTDQFDSYSIVVAATVDKYGSNSTGGYYGGIYSGLTYNVFTSASDVNSFIDEMTDANKSSSIVAIFMMPSAFVSSKGTSTAKQFDFTYKSPTINTLDGYTPTNKKLLTYPYKLLNVSNMSGQSADYHFEYFEDMAGSLVFTLCADMSPNCTVKLWPKWYNGMKTEGGSSPSVNAIDYGLTLSGFPQCPWVTDSYQAYLAQTGSVSAFGMTLTGQDLTFAQQGASLLTNLFSANVGGTVNSFFGIAQNMAKVNATKSLPPQAGGQTANGALVSMKAKDFLFTDLSIREEFARRIDHYWDMYGYPVHDVIYLSWDYLKTRENWNFIKTQGIIIQGDEVPAQAAEQIQDIFNSGVCFWHNAANFGNFRAPNGIVAGGV